LQFWLQAASLESFEYTLVFHLAVRRRRFSSDEEVFGAVKNWLKTQPKKKTFFFPDGIKKLVKMLEPVR
jgi:hypothetical protein